MDESLRGVLESVRDLFALGDGKVRPQRLVWHA